MSSSHPNCHPPTQIVTLPQEHLALLRRMALAAPAAFPELAALGDAGNEERDFFANVAHLQLHRRGRALARLAKVRGQRSGMRHHMV